MLVRRARVFFPVSSAEGDWSRLTCGAECQAQHWPSHKEECALVQSMRVGCPAEQVPTLLDAMLGQARLASAGLCSTSEFGGKTVPGSEETAYRCMYDIGNFIICQMKMKRRFAGKCCHIVNVMRRYPASTRIQTMGCLIVDKLALNQNLRVELGDSGFANVVLRIIRDLRLDDLAASSNSSIVSLMFHAFGALSSLALDCPSNVRALHELGVAGALLDAFKPHVYPECHREANLTSEFLTCIASLASQDRDLRDLCCTLGCFKILKDAVVGFEHDPRMIRQLCFCIQALVRGNALNVLYFSQHLDIGWLRGIASSKVFDSSVTLAALAAAQIVEDAFGVIMTQRHPISIE
jgi:hypothetical protein